MELTIITFYVLDVTAKKDSTVTSQTSQPFATGEQLQRDDLIVPEYATLEDDFFRLDGTMTLFPDAPESAQFGWWSKEMSDGNGNFTTPQMFQCVFSEPHSSYGITLEFSGDYPDKADLEFYNSSGGVITKRSYTINSKRYFFDCDVEGYAKIIVKFTHARKPYRYVKVSNIMYGAVLEYSDDSVVSASVREEVNPVSSEISMNQLDFTLNGNNYEFDLMNPDGLYRFFQESQKIEVLYGQNPMGTFYLDEWSSEKSTGQFTAYSPIYLLDKTDFLYGRVYNGEKAETIINEIMQSAGWNDYEISDDVKNVLLYGWIPICTHREALQQVAIAAQAIVDDSRGNTIRIYQQVKSYGNIVDRNHKFNSKTTLLSNVTGVEVTAHKYKLSETSEDIFYDELSAGTHEIRFDDAVSDILVSGASVIEQGTNFARISVAQAGEVKISGKKYVDNSTAVLHGSSKNTVKISDATLISANNAQAVAKWLLSYYALRYETNADMILSKERAGEQVALQHSRGNVYSVNTITALTIDLTRGFTASATMIGNGKDVILAYYTGEFYAGEMMGVI